LRNKAWKRPTKLIARVSCLVLAAVAHGVFLRHGNVLLITKIISTSHRMGAVPERRQMARSAKNAQPEQKTLLQFSA
jgi:hypothetical protein